MPLLATLQMDQSCANVPMPPNLAKLVIKLALQEKKQKLTAISQDVFVLEQTAVQALKMMIVTFALTLITPKTVAQKHVMLQKQRLLFLMLAQPAKTTKNLSPTNVRTVELTK